MGEGVGMDNPPRLVRDLGGAVQRVGVAGAVGPGSPENGGVAGSDRSGGCRTGSRSGRLSGGTSDGAARGRRDVLVRPRFRQVRNGLGDAELEFPAEPLLLDNAEEAILDSRVDLPGLYGFVDTLADAVDLEAADDSCATGLELEGPDPLVIIRVAARQARRGRGPAAGNTSLHVERRVVNLRLRVEPVRRVAGGATAARRRARTGGAGSARGRAGVPRGARVAGGATAARRACGATAARAGSGVGGDRRVGHGGLGLLVPPVARGRREGEHREGDDPELVELVHDSLSFIASDGRWPGRVEPEAREAPAAWVLREVSRLLLRRGRVRRRCGREARRCC